MMEPFGTPCGVCMWLQGGAVMLNSAVMSYNTVMAFLTGLHLAECHALCYARCTAVQCSVQGRTAGTW